MTNLGFITSIDRHGVNKLDTDPLSRASFEMPIEQLATDQVALDQLAIDQLAMDQSANYIAPWEAGRC